MARRTIMKMIRVLLDLPFGFLGSGLGMIMGSVFVGSEIGGLTTGSTGSTGGMTGSVVELEELSEELESSPGLTG